MAIGSRQRERTPLSSSLARFTKRMLAALRLGETRLRLLVEQLPVVLWTTDRDLRFTSSLGAGLTALGLRSNETVGMSLFEYLETSDADSPAIVAHRRALQGESTTYEHDSLGRVFQVYVEPLRGEDDDAIEGVIGVALDITERKRAEAAQGRLAAIVESSDDAIVGLTLEGTITSWNPAAERLYDYSAAEALGRSIALIIPPDRSDELDRNLRRLARGERLDPYDTVRLRRDTTRVDVSITMSPIRDPAGRIIGASGSARDIRERKGLEQELARLAAIVESSDDAIIGKTLDGVITSWNRAAERLYGYSAAEALGRSIALIMPPDRSHELDEILQRLARGERVENYEAVRVRKDGTRIDVSITISPVKDGAGRIVGASGIGRDITERKRAEAARWETAVLRSVASLASAAAHEINNALAVVSGNLELISKHADDPTARRRLEAAIGAAERIHQVVMRMNRVTELRLVEHSRNLPDMLDLWSSPRPEGPPQP
ncbi:MAG: PAS domain S-box protein [Candidatus Rokubacteria bacterium]|nr:PAS domain S-box protein [Candidatus Rokubacteria bacterium]